MTAEKISSCFNCILQHCDSTIKPIYSFYRETDHSFLKEQRDVFLDSICIFVKKAAETQFSQTRKLKLQRTSFGNILTRPRKQTYVKDNSKC